MKQRWAILGFATCAALVIGGLAWVTFHTLRLERMEVVARADARLQESIRLVLWRMDSTLTPIIAREAARPYFEYQPFYAADRAFAGAGKGSEEREVLVPSPLLRPVEPFVRVYYQRDGGVLSSPQVPTGVEREMAEGAYVTGYAVAAAQQRLEELGVLLAPQIVDKLADIRARSPLDGASVGLSSVGAGQTATVELQQLQFDMPPPPPAQVGATLESGPNPQLLYSNDYQARQAVTDRAKNIGDPKLWTAVPQRSGPPAPDAVLAVTPGAPAAESPPTQTASMPPRSEAASRENKQEDAERAAGLSKGAAKDDRRDGREGAAAEKKAEDRSEPVATGRVAFKEMDGAGEAIGQSVTQGQFIAHWMEDPAGGEPQLIFTREVAIGERTLRQGFWLDWPGLRTTLLDSAKDLLPQSSLRPVTDPARVMQNEAMLGRTLAAIPVELILPAISPPTMPAWTPVRTVIAVTWLAVLLAVVATGLVLRASLELAERRGRFVSAVTHELRTPLTTFCLYSQMLADGMVKDEEAQRGYFATLKNESQRLARIVESVLDYARLSGRRTTRSPVTTTLCDLIVPLRRPLAARCEQSGMTLEIEGDVHDSRPLTTDPAIVERVVYNLVDNACKYASESEDRRIHLEMSAGERDVTLTVRDHGPGIDAGESARLFRPFVRGAKHGHGAIPGLGLGLAIAKGLAKELGGELECESGGEGAAFTFRVPRQMA